MSEKTTLLVPVEVQALYLTQEQAGDQRNRVLGPTSNFSALPFVNPDEPNTKGAYTSHKVVSRAFSSTGAIPTPGVHLRWLVPDSLATGTVDESDIRFKQVPNRWLVMRVARKPDQAPVIDKRWLVESDRVTDEGGTEKTSIPTQIDYDRSPPRRTPFAYLGQVFNADEWPGETDHERYELTAVGFGESEFNAYYPDCRGVFGFHDDLGGKPLDPDVALAYVAVGWHHGNDDPLTAGPLAATLAGNRWELVGHDADAVADVAHTLYHGAVIGISAEPSAVSAATSVVAAVGNSTTEALSALIAKLATKPADDPRPLERQLNALQWELVNRNGNPDCEEYRQAAHQAGFFGDVAPLDWSLHPVVEGHEQPPPIPTEVAAALRELNRLQDEYNVEQEAVAGRRWQLFSDSCKLQLLRYGEGSGSFETLQAMEKESQSVTGYLVKIAKELAEHESPYPRMIQEQRGKLEAILQDRLKGKYQLFASSGPRYWRANDPVVLLAGDAARPAARSHGDGRFSATGQLCCRLGSDVISRIDSRQAPPRDEVLPRELANKLSRAPVDVMAAVLGEACLFDRELATELQSDPTLDRHEFDGQPPCPLAYQPYQHPWLPIMLHWQAKLFPFQKIPPETNLAADGYDETWIADRFNLLGPSLTYKNGDVTTESQTYTGETVLSSGARVTLKEHIQKLIALTDVEALKKTLRQLADKFHDWPAVSQSLEGFHESLLMQWHALQMDVADPHAEDGDPLYDPNRGNLSKAVGDANTQAPLPANWFNPIRAGLLKFERLRLIDAFGRFSDVLKGGNLKLVVAEDLQPPEGLKPQDGNRVFLPPRLPQSSRLRLRWLPSQPREKRNTAIVESPACGWFIANELDNSLMVYDEQGRALGALVLGKDNAVAWRNAPLSADPDQPIRDAVKDVDAGLEQCVLALWEDGRGTYLKQILECLKNARMGIGATYHRQGDDPWFVGRRLMLARVELDLDLRQLPALNQSWLELLNTINRFKENPRDISYASRITSGFTEVQFPVRLGNLAQRDDGLVGYFVDDKYDTFYSSASDAAEGRVVNPDKINQPIRVVAADDPAEPKKHARHATLLFDPTAKIHAATGIHPIKTIDVPASLHEAIRDELQVTFLTSPLISHDFRLEKDLIGEDIEELALPLPGVSPNRWSWVERLEGGWNEIPHDKLGGVDEKEGKSMYPLAVREGWLRLGPKPQPKPKPKPN